LVAIGALLSLAIFVPWGQFLSSTLESTGAPKRQKAVVDNNPQYGAAAGATVNVTDLKTFPPNGSWVVTYPSSGDSTLDAENPDTFVKWMLIRLPTQLKGDEPSAASFVAFSKVCVHLWCSPNYDPTNSTNPANETYQCPCHGSIYEVADGKAIMGPASLQPPPTNAIPMLTLTNDSSGDLYIEVPVFDVDHNGIVGYGRNYQSYDTYIKPAALASPSVTSGGSSSGSSTASASGSSSTG
jgi:Rieske Fe-S protein